MIYSRFIYIVHMPVAFQLHRTMHARFFVDRVIHKAQRVTGRLEMI